MIGFDLGGSVNSFTKWVCGAPIIHTIINNPFYTSLLITCIVVIVIMSNYHYQIKKNKRAVKTVVYIFLLVTAVLFVHHCALSDGLKNSLTHQGVRDVFTSIQQSRNSGIANSVPVIPLSWTSQPTYGGYQQNPYSLRDDNIATKPIAEIPLEIHDVQLPSIPRH